MKPMNLEIKNTYKVIAAVKACVYDENDCVLPDMADLPTGMKLTYTGPDADDGYVFVDDQGTKFCLHDNDLAGIEPA